MSDFSDDMGDIPEQSFEKNDQNTENEVRLIEASEPELTSEPEPDSKTAQMTNNGKVKPETIEIQNRTTVLPYVTSQPVRTKHFMFTKDTDTQQLTKILENTGLTVEYSTVRDNPYITLKKGGETNSEVVGKIHFLYHNENTPENKYIKLYLFDFTDSNLYSTVKSKLVNFFENFNPSATKEQGGARRKSNKKHHRTHHRTHKKRRNIRRKKTLRRK